MRTKIITDSACDLQQELREKYDITILPLHIQKGGESFLDMVEITPLDIFEYSDRTGSLPARETCFL